MSDSWKRIRTENIISNSWLTVEKNDYSAHGRTITEYYIIRRSPFVLVVAEVGDTVLLIRQFRPATEQFYWSVPGGYVDSNEDVISAASRELLEETGVSGRNFRIVGSLDPLPGYISSRAHVVRCSIENSSSVRTSDEALRVTFASWSDIENRIRAGQITEMQAVAALLLVRLTGQ